MSFIPTQAAFTPSAVTHSTTPPVPFTPVNVTPSAVPPSVFDPSGVTPCVTLPGVFFPLVSVVGSTAQLLLQPTLLVTPAASEVVFVITPGVGQLPATFQVWTLTAGAHAVDGTHLRPADYNASKHWALTASGYVGPVLIDENESVIVDENGNAFSVG